MAYRLVVLDQAGKRYVAESDSYGDLLTAAGAPALRQEPPLAMTIQELPPIESVSWSQVAEGDEVLDPHGGTWTVDAVVKVNNLCQYAISNVRDGSHAKTTPRADLTVRRRGGAITTVRQMLTEAGIATTFVR